MKVVKCHCDICNAEGVKNVDIQVIFTTEQTEGRSTKPYLYNQNIDICDDCLQKRLKGESLYAQGAMGFNKYYFKNS